ncbi:MAG: protein jag, partial [Chloroflexota bacterium]
RPPRRDDRPRDDRPRADRPPRGADRPRDDRPRTDDRGPRPDRRDDRPPRPEERGARPAPRDDRRGSGLSQREAAEVETARAAHPAVAREEVQAADASPEALAAGREIVEQLIRLMGFEATVSVRTDGTPKIEIEGANDEDRDALGALIGRKGERLSALQHLVNLMLSRKMGEWTRVLVDVEDYRGRRERQLADLARRAADKVLESGTMLQLEPMPPLERRWVHIALKGIPGISTQSIGEEPERRVVILRIDG